ncbi:MAG: RagB/SusD family nutrient uptake outer membrane protein [Rikenellaceae bacterium]|nr:RagB/SusD family nutrient uptake outer membrane protein [Rikenellaceae bacterium]
MKYSKLFIVGILAMLGLSACSDYLDVKSDSKYDEEYVFGNMEEINRALTTCYTYLLSGSTYGGAYYSTFCLNSDVEFATNSSDLQSSSGGDYKQFDSTPAGSALQSTWQAAYQNIEYCNNFIKAASTCAILEENKEELMQMIGEAKCIRAMNYHDMVVLFGDVPFSMERALDSPMVMPVADRDTILQTLIDDLKEAAESMKFAAALDGGVQRCSKEFAWALIARMSLTAGGYSLRPGASTAEIGTMQRPANYQEHYKTAMTYAGKVIAEGNHSLKKRYDEYFIDQCNYLVTNDDDSIFEIPYTKGVNGNVGYNWGPAYDMNGDETQMYDGSASNWGRTSGSNMLSVFYRFSFDEKDLRRNYVCGTAMWKYGSDGKVAMRLDPWTAYCGKWSKLWTEAGNTMGAISQGNTGINYPYMRYADVLLMYAEAANEVNNGPTAEAIDAFKQVRRRAFQEADWGEKVDNYVAAAGSKDAFLELIQDERKWEFGGEGLRWRDLVRWNKYAEVLRDVFYQYFGYAWYVSGDEMYNTDDRFTNLPAELFYKTVDADNNLLFSTGYDYTKFGSMPNTALPVIEIYNPWTFVRNPGAEWAQGYYLSQMYDDTNGYPKGQALFSLRGYIRATDHYGSQVVPDLWEVAPESLPTVRYILPYPEDVVARSGGAYENKYGYR